MLADQTSVHRRCFDRQVLIDLSLGKLPDEEAERVAAEVETCPTCRSLMETLDNLEDSVVRQLKGLPTGPAAETDPQIEEAIRQAEEISQVVWREQPSDAPERQVDLGNPAAQEPPARLGQYELLERIGRGGMGTVWKALHTRLKRPVAIKLLPAERMQDPNAVARFQREMEAVGRLDHQNLVRAHDAGEAEGQHFLAMEYIDGVDLAKLVRSQGRLAVADACEAIRQAALGLQYAHEHGLIHRDVKPSNLMLTAGGQVKVLDLGLARLSSDQAEADAITGTGQVVGTGDYIAPEQGQDTRRADARSDIYSLGCTFYFLLTGHAPFSGPEHNTFVMKVMAHARQPLPSIAASRGDVPDPLLAVLERMTAKSPDERFQSAADVARALEAYAAGSDLTGIVPQRSGPHKEDQGRLPQRSLRNGIWVTGILLVLVTLAFPVYRYGAKLLYVLRNLPDPAENQRMVEKVHADMAELNREIDSTTQELRREWDIAIDDLTAESRSPNGGSAAPAGLRQSEGFDIWQVAGPFLYDSSDEAYGAEHPIEKEPFQVSRCFDTPEGRLGWRRFEAASNAESRIVLAEAAGRAPSVGRVGVYYAVCWAKFAGSHSSVDLRFLASCPYKLWINRTPAKGSPDDGGNFGGGILSHGGTDGWNELLFKFVVSSDRKSPADFRLRFRRQQDRFGRPVNQPLPSIAVEPPIGWLRAVSPDEERFVRGIESALGIRNRKIDQIETILCLLSDSHGRTFTPDGHWTGNTSVNETPMYVVQHADRQDNLTVEQFAIPYRKRTQLQPAPHQL